MTNPQRGEAEVRDRTGRVYTVAFRTNEIAKLEAIFGTDNVGLYLFGDRDEGVAPHSGMSTWRSVVRVILERHHSDVVGTDEAAGDLHDEFDSDVLARAVLCAMYGWTNVQLDEKLDEAKAKTKKFKAASGPPVMAATS